jgi:hypothetical protein
MASPSTNDGSSSPDLTNKKATFKKASRRAISFSNIFGGTKKEEISQLQEENRVLK